MKHFTLLGDLAATGAEPVGLLLHDHRFSRDKIRGLKVYSSSVEMALPVLLILAESLLEELGTDKLEPKSQKMRIFLRKAVEKLREAIP